MNGLVLVSVTCCRKRSKSDKVWEGVAMVGIAVAMVLGVIGPIIWWG